MIFFSIPKIIFFHLKSLFSTFSFRKTEKTWPRKPKTGPGMDYRLIDTFSTGRAGTQGTQGAQGPKGPRDPGALVSRDPGAQASRDPGAQASRDPGALASRSPGVPGPRDPKGGNKKSTFLKWLFSRLFFEISRFVRTKSARFLRHYHL